MKTVENQVKIPEEFQQQISNGDMMHIIILVNEPTALMETDDSLKARIARIKQRPSRPENIRTASGLLAEHLANPLTEPESDFDAAAWNQQWDKVEQEMNIAQRAEEQQTQLSL